jgi:RNA polymerase sigma factor (TIGR02999 family)
MKAPNPVPPSSNLKALRAGDSDALKRLRHDIRRLAGAYMKGERPGHSLDASDLAQEVFLRLMRSAALAAAEDTASVLVAAAGEMRRMLVDHARARGTQKRGSNPKKVPLDEVLDTFVEKKVNLIPLHDALESLRGRHKRQAEVVDLRYFAGLTCSEAAEVLKVSVSTVEADTRWARAFLLRQLRNGDCA